MIKRDNAKRLYEENLVHDLLELFDTSIQDAIDNGNSRAVVEVDFISEGRKDALIEVFKRYGWFGHVTIVPNEKNTGKTTVTFEIA